MRLTPSLGLLLGGLFFFPGCQGQVPAAPAPVTRVTPAPVSTPPLWPLRVQPLGDFPPQEAAQLTQSLERQFRLAVRVAPAQPLPRETYSRRYGRYRAQLLNNYFYRRAQRGERILLLTTRDISATKGPYPDWGLFGLAQTGGTTCVVSTHRLKRGVSSRTLRLRLQRVASHEVGHVLGLPHCPNPQCTMQDYQGGVRGVHRDQGFCPRCRASLRDFLRPT